MADDRNVVFAVDGYGTRYCHGTRVQHGIKIFSEEQSARTYRTFHPSRRVAIEFGLTIIHPSYDEYRDFNEFLKVYVERITTPDNTLGPMRVIVKDQQFDRMALVYDGIGFGRQWDAFFWVQPLTLKTVSDPLDLSEADLSGISAAYLSTYYEPGGQPGDYLSNYAIASLSDAISSGSTTYEDALYNARVPSIPSPSHSPDSRTTSEH